MQDVVDDLQLLYDDKVYVQTLVADSTAFMELLLVYSTFRVLKRL